MDCRKGNMTVLRNSVGGVKEHVQFCPHRDEIIPMSQMVSYALNAQQRRRSPMSLFTQDDIKADREKAQEAAASPLENVTAIPSSLSELCLQMQQRIKECALLPPSKEDQGALEAVMSSELGLIWHDLQSSRPDPLLSRRENQALRRETFNEVLHLCEQLYLSYLHLLHSLRRRAVFTDSANRSRLAAQMASDCTSVLNVHSIRRGVAARIKAQRKARPSTGGQTAREERQGPTSDTAPTPDRLTLSVPTGKTRPLSKKHRLALQRDIAEIKEKIGDFDLESVYELMPYRLEWTVDVNKSREVKIDPDEDLPAVPAEDEECNISDGLCTRLKGCRSMPELSRETLLEELEMESPPPRPRSPLVLLTTRRPLAQKHTLSLADDLQKLLEDDVSLDNSDSDVDIPPLIKARFHRNSARLQRLQATLQARAPSPGYMTLLSHRLRERRERVARSRVALRSPVHPQAEVVSVALSGPPQATARMAVARVSDRLEPEKININMFPPVYNDVDREIEVSSVQWMDRNLFAGAEVKEVCRELSKNLINRYLGFEEDPLIEPYETQRKLKARKKTPSNLINTALKNSISSKKRAEAPVDYKKPADMTSRAYTAWFQWWKSYLSLDDYLRYITGQELDYLAVVFQLHETEVKKDTEEEKMKALQQQRDEKKRARTKKIEALKRMKQEYIMGVWNVNSVLLGGLWNEPVLEEEGSPEEEEASNVKQGTAQVTQEPSEVPGQVDADQLKARLERIWTVLCLPDGVRLDMAIKYSSHAYRDQLEKAIVAWEQAARLIQQREAILSKLELFEWEASDPNRFFHQGHRGTAVARMEESRKREEMNSQMTSLEKELTKVMTELSNRYKDTVTYKGRPYREKMRWDRTEMLYWLQQERRVQSLERVVMRRGSQPVRLPPLQLVKEHSANYPPNPTPLGPSPPHAPMPLYGLKLTPELAVSQTQLYVPRKEAVSSKDIGGGIYSRLKENFWELKGYSVCICGFLGSVRVSHPSSEPLLQDTACLTGRMEERARSCLLRSRPNLEADIKATYLMDHMISDGVLTNDEEERVLQKATRKEQAAALLEVLLRKDNRAYISFYNALVRESYGDLASLLHPDLPMGSPEAEKSFSDGGTSLVQLVLSEGGVPQRPVVFVGRPELLNQVRAKLYQLQGGPGWVTVYGMAGSGKSVLASEAVRDHGLITECFPDGVQWVSVGQMERSDLLVRMQSLCFRLEQSQSPESCHRPPCSIEEAKERLRFLMLRRYPRSLLILDDIWDSSVLKAFDIQCRVLLTTRDRSLADSVSGQRYEVAVESGLEEDKALEVLALYVNSNPRKLPEQARSIVKECKGSPLVVSLIGALLREFPERWDYYLRQLQRKQFRRIRKSSSYDYEALDQAMDASLQVLSDEHRALYTDLTVLEKDVKVPAKVLSILWDLEVEDVEDVLQEFVNKSLLFRDCNQRPYLYYLHDLQLDFLSELNRTRLAELHTKVVRQYQQHYKAGPPVSGDTESLYWLRYLTYHMAKAGLSQELYTLMFSLDWVSTKARLMGPAHLINDYVEYAAILDKENGEVRGQFQEFLSLSGHHLEQRPFPDVVQLALSQPDASEVHRQARLQAQRRAHQGALYLDWVNKNSLESLSRLVLQPHQGVVYYACFSRDGSKIASCGASRKVRVFKSTSGEKLLELQAGDDEVLCCAFSPDDRLIATCSADRKIKVWNAERGTLIRTFAEEHEEQINHCQFTNTRHRLLLATCSNDMNTKLWNLNKPSSQNTMFGHMDAVNHCCFSPDDKYLATSSSDGLLKMFEVTSANEWKSIDVSEHFPEAEQEVGVMVTCSTWSADGKRIICAAKNAVFVFDVASADLVCEIRASRHSTVQFCHACPNSQLLAIALSYYTVELWNFESNKKVADCTGHLSWVRCVQFSPDGSQLLSCSDDQTIRLWEPEKVHTSSAASLKRDSDVLFTSADVTVVAADNRNRLQVRSGPTGGVVFESERQESRIRCTCICTQPAVVALGREDGAVKVMEVPSGATLATLSGHSRTVFHCLFTQDGQLLVTSSEDTTIRVWKWRTGECVVLQGHTESVRRFALLPPASSSSSSSSHLLSWSFDGTVKVWDMVLGAKLQDVPAHRGAILSCDISPDGRRFSTASADQTAKVWSCESWDLVFTLSGHKDCVRSCRFSGDGRRLATGDDNGEIRLWNMLDGTLLKVCCRGDKDAMDSQHGGWVTDLHFSPDNKVLVSTGGYIKLPFDGMLGADGADWTAF
ncbi:hypothetical protein ACEWY4_002161 [Coilia grayii]|uniref:Apoptotic protease-activating factor 1 n=1 Tax=Coilia grayii TaxID=363190 RepID=A0ABD1KW89_9TELE